jgi:iron complex transport system permease protein
VPFVATTVAGDSRSSPAVEPRASPHLIHGAWYRVFLVALVAAIFASLCASVAIGPVGGPIGEALRALGHHIAPSAVGAPHEAVFDQIVWELRAPRALLALVVGGGLAVAGCVLQAVVRNPLADPYVLGAVSGASFGAVAVIVFGSAAVGGLDLPAAAFVGALASLAAVFALGRHAGRFSPTRLVLAGVALAYLFAAATSYLQIHADDNELRAVVFWLLGSVADAEWNDLPVAAAVVVLVSGWLLLHTRPLNSLLIGDESAYALGKTAPAIDEILIAGGQQSAVDHDSPGPDRVTARVETALLLLVDAARSAGAGGAGDMPRRSGVCCARAVHRGQEDSAHCKVVAITAMPPE